MNARNPKRSMNPPRAASGTEWPGMSMGFPALVNLPFLGPMKAHATRAQVAPNRWPYPLTPKKSKAAPSLPHKRI